MHMKRICFWRRQFISSISFKNIETFNLKKQEILK